MQRALAAFVVFFFGAAVACSSHGPSGAGSGGQGGAAIRSASGGDGAGNTASSAGSGGMRGGTTSAGGSMSSGGRGSSTGTGGSAANSNAIADAGEDDASSASMPSSNDRGSCKRGVAYGFDPTGAVDDLAALSSGVSWYYGWANGPNAQLANDYARLGVEFVPMVWGGSFNVADVVKKIPDGARYLLGFNEPNFNAQANLTPQKAAELWPQLEDIARQKHLALVSPALNYCGGGCNVTNPVDWMDQFFAACTNCKIDYVAVHWYACTGDALKSYVAMFKKYGKPIWLTEFSCGDSGTQPVTKQQSYMKDALAYLESDPDIFRYAWFSGRTTSIANVGLLSSPGQLTTLGHDYVSLPEPAACQK